MYLPNYEETLDWNWKSVNYEVYCNELTNAPDGPLQMFVEYCVGWYRR